MFPKKNRFNFKSDLPKRIIHSDSFTLRYGKNVGGVRVAVVVSKRVDKRAVVRNKIKRRMLSSIKKFVDTSEPLNLIFYVKKNVLNSEDLEKEIQQVINNITI